MKFVLYARKHSLGQVKRTQNFPWSHHELTEDWVFSSTIS